MVLGNPFTNHMGGIRRSPNILIPLTSHSKFNDILTKELK